MIDIFEIGTIKRLPLETSYTNVVAIVHALLLRCPAGTELVIDGTGVGKPVADMFKWHGVAPWCVSSTAGIEQTIDTAARTANVPKLLLISRIQSLLFEGRLKVQDRIAAFLAELRDYRVEYTASEQMTYNAKAGRHDDMVSAAAVAAWRLSDGAVGWGPPTAELAAMFWAWAAPMRDPHLGPSASTSAKCTIRPPSSSCVASASIDPNCRTAAWNRWCWCRRSRTTRRTNC